MSEYKKRFANFVCFVAFVVPVVVGTAAAQDAMQLAKNLLHLRLPFFEPSWHG